MLPIVTLMRGKASLTYQMLRSLKDTTSIPYHVICVENPSTDPFIQPDDIPPITLICQETKNINESINIGFREALKLGTDKVLCVNNDIVFGYRTVDNMVAAMDRFNFDTIRPPDTVFDLPENWHENAKERGLRPVVEPKPGDLLGCCFLISRRAWELCGEFDEGYDFWWSEADYANRLIKIPGIKSGLIENGIVHHFVSQTANDLADTMQRKESSYTYFKEKWG